jgi:hypothetical protein
MYYTVRYDNGTGLYAGKADWGWAVVSLLGGASISSSSSSSSTSGKTAESRRQRQDSRGIIAVQRSIARLAGNTTMMLLLAYSKPCTTPLSPLFTGGMCFVASVSTTASSHNPPDPIVPVLTILAVGCGIEKPTMVLQSSGHGFQQSSSFYSSTKSTSSHTDPR